MSELSVQKVTGVTEFRTEDPITFSSLIIDSNTSTDVVRIIQRGSGNAFTVDNPANSAEPFFAVSNTGNVGFGTLTPTSKLDILGTIKATTFEGNGAGLSGIQPFPSGTMMLFGQTTAPTGWTKSTTHNDKALRVVSGSASSGGSVAFTTAFASQSVSGTIGATTASGTIGSTSVTGTVGSTTLSTNEMPSHSHVVPAMTSGNQFAGGSGYFYTTGNSQFTGGSGSHTHSFTGGSHNHTFTGTSHGHTFSGTAINMAVQYVDVIMATKD